LKPSFSSAGNRPASCRYSVTTREPGASDVLTHGLDAVRPRATAFLANRPAPSMTAGFDVLVHEVMAAITTAPWPTSAVAPPTWTATLRCLRASASGPFSSTTLRFAPPAAPDGPRVSSRLLA